jgi:peptidyl-dipeptidase Dcp
MNRTLQAGIASACLLLAAGCAGDKPAPTADAPSAESAAPAETAAVPAANPLLAASWDTPHGAVPFDRIQVEHFAPAFEEGMKAHLAEIAAITSNPEPATFENTLLQLERSGRRLERAFAVFGNLASANSTDEIRAIQREYAPRLAAHQSRIRLDPALFARIEAVMADKDMLKPDQQRVVERTHIQFVRAGAKLDEAGRQRVAAIDQRMAELSTRFSQNLLADTEAFTLTLSSEEDLAGLPDSLRQAAAETARQRGQEGKYLITLQRPSVEPFLSYSSNRALREKAWRAWSLRGDNNDEYDNKAVVAEIVALRAERSQLLGYATFADFALDDSMAGSPDAAMDLMRRVWEPAIGRAREELMAIEALAKAEGADHPIEAWDWRYYAEKVRKQQFDLGEGDIKPYLQLDKLVEGMFHVGNRLFGVSFSERNDIPVTNPSIRVFEVKNSDGAVIGLFYGDWFARQGKQSGAWMSGYQRQHKLDGGALPHIINVMNINAPAAGTTALVSFDDAVTLFHEFGHALHGLLSDQTYPSISGAAVSRDFVEFPAQFMEHYMTQPYILKTFALHHETGQPMSDELIDKLLRSRTFNQGFATVEFLGSALVDKAFHRLSVDEARKIDVAEFERQTLASLGMLDEIGMRHRSPHFSHVFAGGYASAYYSYMWSEVLDADGFAAFKEAGDIFDPELAQRLKTYVYAAGNSRPPMEAYVAFRGREPNVDALLENRGFTDES